MHLMRCMYCERVASQWHELRFYRSGIRSLLHPIQNRQKHTRRDFAINHGTNGLLRSFATARSLKEPGPDLHKVSHIAERRLLALQDKVNEVLQNPTSPSTESIRSIVRGCEAYARAITAKLPSSSPSDGDKSPASSLLSLEEQPKDVTNVPPTNTHLDASTRNKIALQVSALAYNIMTDSKVFISPKILASYVRTQSFLGFPGTIPQVFILYASKPLPVPGRIPIEFSTSNPNNASSAIPLNIANAALSAAIEARDLPLCFDIINTSICTTAFRRSKLIRRALLPIMGIAAAPVAAYAVASQLSLYQDAMDSTVATNIVFAGTLAYICFTATIGVVAVTTANDQMDRITWASGTPLRERWMREEERALIDRVAGAWGFQELSKRGEEEGKDWETLREWVGMRGMILDRVELMEGME